MMNHPKLTPERLARRAIVYIRQSKPMQVIHNQESQRLQYRLVERARELGFAQVHGDRRGSWTDGLWIGGAPWIRTLAG